MSEPDFVALVGVPEPNTNEMVTFLHAAIHNGLCGMREMFPYTRGDAMSACMHIIVDSGLETTAPEKLRADVVEALDSMLADIAQKRQKAN